VGATRDPRRGSRKRRFREGGSRRRKEGGGRTVNFGLRLDLFFAAGAGFAGAPSSPSAAPTSVGDCGTPASARGCCGIHSSRGAVQSFDQ